MGIARTLTCCDLVAASVLTLAACHHAAPAPAVVPQALPADDVTTTYLFVEQDGARVRIEDGAVLDLRKASFLFVFPLDEYDEAHGRFYGARFVGWHDPSVLAVRTGADAADQGEGLTFFASGRGMAAYPGGYESFFLTDRAHHYLAYSTTDADMSRVDLIRPLGTSRYEVGFPVGRFMLDEREVDIRELPFEALYFVAFFDGDLDGILDPGELFRFTVRFH